MSSTIRKTIHTKSVHELFELVKNSTSPDTKEKAINELIKRGYSIDDIQLTLN